MNSTEGRSPQEGVPWNALIPVPDANLVIGLGTAGAATSSTERLAQILDAHVRAEVGSVDAYRRIIEASPDPVVRLVLELVLEDEERHHGLLQRIQTSLHDALDWTSSARALPETAVVQLGGGAASAARLRALFNDERVGGMQFRRLAKENRDIHGGLLSLLLEWMGQDSDKHAAAILYILKRMKAAEAAPTP